MVPSAVPPPHFRRVAESAARFVRLFSLGATLLYPLAGIATSSSRATGGAVGWAILIGVLFHIYADVANDVMDLPLDRTDPRRLPDPLVRGSVSPQLALVVSVTMLPLMLACVLGAAPGGAGAPLIAATVLIGLYDLAGKALPVPFAADLVEGAGAAFLVVMGAELGGGVTPATWWAAGVVLLYIAMVNGLHGAIRDAQNDSRSGARTTALLLGVRIADARSITLPRGVVAYGALLQAAIGVVLVGFLISGAPARPGSGWIIATVATSGLFAASVLTIHRAYRDRRELRRAMAAGTWHLFLIPASLTAAAAWRMPAWMVAVTITLFLAPPVLFGWAVRGTSFGIPSTTASGKPSRPGLRRQRLAALWKMTRVGTPLAAAALAAIGVHLGSGIGTMVLPAMLATALAVAAANVYNDRCDLAADTVNRPDRPLPAGLGAANDADRFVFAAALGVVAVAAAIGIGASIAAGAFLAVALCYSLFVRRIVVLGQVTVAALFASPVLYGGWFASGGVRIAHWIATALVALFVFARETLKGIPDRLGDAAAGYRTIATAFGERAALSVFRAVAAVFCLSSVVATFAVGSIAYLLAVVACGVAPTVHVIRLVKGSPAHEAVNAAISFSGLVFALGVVPLALLR